MVLPVSKPEELLLNAGIIIITEFAALTRQWSLAGSAVARTGRHPLQDKKSISAWGGVVAQR